MIWLFFILWFIIAGWYTKRKFDSDAEIETWYDKLPEFANEIPSLMAGMN